MSSNGKITAKKKGAATISAKIYVGSTNVKTYKKSVTVKAASASTFSSDGSYASTTSSGRSSSASSSALKTQADSYKMSSTSVTLEKGKTAGIYCGYANSTGNAYGGGDTFKWAGSNTSVASISASNNKCTITGKGKGSANVTCVINGVTCNVGAAAVLFAARDLGLEARYRYVGSSYDYSGSTKGCADEYYNLGMSKYTGHVCTVVTINGKDTNYEAQGHAG